jgi:hypothetical protein
LRKPPAGFKGERTVLRGQLLRKRRVIRRSGHNSDVLEVLCGGADHRRAADVDVLDHLGKLHARPDRRLLEGIEIHHHHVDRLNIVRRDLLAMARVLAPVEDAAVYLRVQRLHSAVQHLREAGQIRNVADIESCLAQRPRSASGGDQFDAVAGEGAGKFDEARFIRHAQQRAGDAFFTAHRKTPEDVFRNKAG